MLTLISLHAVVVILKWTNQTRETVTDKQLVQGCYVVASVGVESTSFELQGRTLSTAPRLHHGKAYKAPLSCWYSTEWPDQNEHKRCISKWTLFNTCYLWVYHFINIMQILKEQPLKLWIFEYLNPQSETSPTNRSRALFCCRRTRSRSIFNSGLMSSSSLLQQLINLHETLLSSTSKHIHYVTQQTSSPWIEYFTCEEERTQKYQSLAVS